MQMKMHKDAQFALMNQLEGKKGKEADARPTPARTNKPR